jgi:hypothetical protein
MTDALNATIALDADDLHTLAETGTLWFPLGDQTVQLHTRPRPTTDPLAIRVTDAHLDALREHGQVTFRRDWGRIVVTLTPALVISR